jgi:hypothetical protein
VLESFQGVFEFPIGYAGVILVSVNNGTYVFFFNIFVLLLEIGGLCCKGRETTNHFERKRNATLLPSSLFGAESF